MPVVPTYDQRGVRLDPGLNFRDNTRATGDMWLVANGSAIDWPKYST
ncbi:hypothetical protein [uncultured Pleomorphomonas sp.]|nr:hypothetical protein [uncultured Pleomorphomonas sp.]